jgi:hypothetical protein
VDPEVIRDHDGVFVQGTRTAKPYARPMSLDADGVAVAKGRSSRDPYQLIIFGCASVASLVVHFLGPRFKINVNDLLQVLDPTLLTHHLLGSLWNLHEQPPLFNLAIGILLRLPSGLQAPIAEFVYFLLYAMICMATYASMRLLSIPRKLALGVVLVFVVLDPAQLLFSKTILYATPTAALVTVLGYLGIRLGLNPTTRNAALFATAGAVLSLFNTSLQPLAFIVLVGAVALLLPGARRSILKGACIPCAVLSLWVLHMIISFGTPATSTWMGMNLARTTTAAAPRALVNQLIARHELSPLASVEPFSPLKVYGVQPNRKGDGALTEVTKSDREDANLNNRAYIDVSSQSFGNDLRFIENEPVQYAKQIAGATGFWFVPSDQVAPFKSPTLGTYRDIYDHFAQMELQRGASPASLTLRRMDVNWMQISLFQVFVYGSTFIGIPILILRNWRRRRRLAVALTIPGLLVLQSFLAMNLIEDGDNNRFRFEAGTIPLTLSLLVIVTLTVRRPRPRRGVAYKTVASERIKAPPAIASKVPAHQ